MNRILLLGKFGQLGWELHRSLAPLGDIVAVDYPEINLLELESVMSIIDRVRPQIIINATAYTAVDQAESEPEVAEAINAIAPGKLAELTKEHKAALIHYSTDYVFDGSKGRPYLESDLPNPLGTYGSSKLGGEKAIQEVDTAYLIFRTSWVYSLRRDSFVTKVLSWARSQSELRIVDDQVSNPTWCRALAGATALLLAKTGKDPTGWINERRGLYHLAGDGFASRLDWAKLILDFDPKREEQIAFHIDPAKTSDYPTPAKRPLFSALDCEKFVDTFSIRLPSWQDALNLAMNEDG
jgi:dTDP-4-dehydrorhamnose reductase